jgi:hypothetical protein
MTKYYVDPDDSGQNWSAADCGTSITGPFTTHVHDLAAGSELELNGACLVIDGAITNAVTVTMQDPSNNQATHGDWSINPPLSVTCNDFACALNLDLSNASTYTGNPLLTVAASGAKVFTLTGNVTGGSLSNVPVVSLGVGSYLTYNGTCVGGSVTGAHGITAGTSAVTLVLEGTIKGGSHASAVGVNAISATTVASGAATLQIGDGASPGPACAFSATAGTRTLTGSVVLRSGKTCRVGPGTWTHTPAAGKTIAVLDANGVANIFPSDVVDPQYVAIGQSNYTGGEAGTYAGSGGGGGGMGLGI